MIFTLITFFFSLCNLEPKTNDFTEGQQEGGKAKQNQRHDSFFCVHCAVHAILFLMPIRTERKQRH